MLRRAGLPVAMLEHPDHMAPVDRIQNLLADCAKAAMVEEFGLTVGAAFKISMLGPLGLLLREQPSLRDAMSAFSRYLRYQDENLEVRLELRGDGLMVVPLLLSPRSRASRQMVEMTLAALVQIVRGLLDETWRPTRTSITFPSPHDPRAYADVLGPVEFGAAFTGFLLTGEELATRFPNADAQLARELTRFIKASTLPASATMSEIVHVLILRLLSGGACSVDRIAEHLGVDRRTVHRRLAAEGRSFTQILEASRREVASWQLSHGDQPLGEVTTLVGFSSLSTFSRWFRQAYGIQPSEYRRQKHVA
jgi:AraC-like DNA-binding protein